jgi:site-specific DNA-cytosine methylase
VTRLFRTTHSGGELFGVGARAAGWTHLDGWEWEPRIAAAAQRNGFDVRVADVCDVDWAALPYADHLHSSPSCKRASQANQPGRDEHGEPLPREMPDDLAAADAVCRSIAAHRGATFTLENVWGYRAFESFDRIRTALSEYGFSYDYWHLNMADYGIPQTRKRLILIARRGLCRIPRPHPTHREGGDMFHAPWKGWYAAITDILHTLPPTKPAKWQAQRLARRPELLETVLVAANDSKDQHGNSYGASMRSADEPALTINTVSPGWWKAYLVGGGNTNLDNPTSMARAADEPAFTVRNGLHGSPERAYLVASNSNSERDGLRSDVEPAHTVTGNAGGRVRPLLIGGYKSGNGSGLVARTGDEPAMTMVAESGSRQLTRGLIEGRWVRMTIKCLGRFQTVPDDYQGLTSEINGNGVPCEFARQLMALVAELRGGA